MFYLVLLVVFLAGWFGFDCFMCVIGLMLLAGWFWLVIDFCWLCFVFNFVYGFCLLNDGICLVLMLFG